MARTSGESELEDVGCFPRVAMSRIKELGIPTESAWPSEAKTVNDPLPWDVIQDASRFLAFRWSRINVLGAARGEAVAQAIAAKYPVIFGLELDPAFFVYQGGTIEELGEERRGGHMLTAIAYRTNTKGNREFTIVNSWGTGWGERGYCWIDEAVLATDRATDFYVLQIVP
jgi:C1A family cysteine protease